jgi:hypothetical protein
MKRATVDIDSTRSLGTEATEKREGARLLLLKIPMFRRTIRSRRSVMPRQVLRAWTRGGIRRSGADSAKSRAGEVWRQNRRFAHEIYHWALRERASRRAIRRYRMRTCIPFTIGILA